ncbi:S-layer protein [Natrarchaeobaculum sulfurireducens]|uniref:S-layer protein n=1 Tax=Natrarchaeobaculum sulfurireducens TaxID=2044521 RepID=A0A346PSJ5_9EURY|nr:S-layer protein [Natrarchaeobaculum sulfurireducens]
MLPDSSGIVGTRAEVATVGVDRRLLLLGVVVAVAVTVVMGAPVALADDDDVDVGEELQSSGSESSGELTRGEPAVDATVPQAEITAGSEENVEIQVQNEGNIRLGTQRDRVTPARGVTVEVVDEGPFDVTSGTTSLGTLDEQQTASVDQRIKAPEDLEPGEHDITVEVSYSYTYQVSDNSRVTTERTGSETIDLTLEVPDEPRFEISDVVTDVEPGGDGPATLEIENVGSEAASQTRATITGGGGVTVDGETAEEVLGDLEPGDSTAVTVDVDIAETTSQGEKPLEIAFRYDDEAGVQVGSPDEPAQEEVASLAPAPEQTFSISNLQDTLAVGYDGVVTGEIENDGPRTVDDGVLIVEPTTDSLFVEDTRYALPELSPGETTEFRFPTDVSGQADAGPRQLRFTVEYGAGDRSTLEDGPISERVVIDDRADEFSITADEIRVAQGDLTEFTLEITNERSETLSNIDARLYADSPLDTDNDEAFVSELEPNESAEITFDVWADQDATTETHPVELDFEYENERGDEVLSDTYTHPIEVESGGDDGGLSIVGILVRVGAVLTALGLGATLWWRLR